MSSILIGHPRYFYGRQLLLYSCMKLDNSILKQNCQPAVFDNPKKNRDLAHQMLRLMKKEHGIGLAANQVGIDIRLFVMSINNTYYHCFNPEIIEYLDDPVPYNEGCLSFPEENCLILRPNTIRVRYSSAQGKATEEILTGLASRCFQHELDHLNGITMLDRTNK